MGSAPASSHAPHRLLDPATPDNPAPRTLCPTLDRSLERILQKCLARDVKDRYPTAQELATDLERWLQPKRSRRPLFAGLASTLALLAVIAVALWPKKPPPPVDHRQELLTALNRDGKVDLLDAHGKPKYARFAAGAEYATEREWVTDQAYSLDTQDTCLLELVPAQVGRVGRFRITAEMRVNRAADPGSLVGLYVGHEEYQTNNGLEHVVAAAHLYPNKHLPKGNPNERYGHHSLSARMIALKPTAAFPKHNGSELLEMTPYNYPFRLPDTDAQWHTMYLEIDPTTLKYALDGQRGSAPVMEVGIAIKQFTKLLGNPLNEVRTPTVASGCGVIVYRAHASFRAINVELLPLK